jgi:dUTP pyrophosphatase
MDSKDILAYVEKLKQIEQDINNDVEVDQNFLKEIDDIMALVNEKMGNAQPQNIATSQPQQTSYNDLNVFNDGFLIKVKKISPNAVIPSYSKVGDAGMDLTITSIIENTSFSVTYGFGISMEIPKNFVGFVFPRSSVRNQELILSNCVGVIDSGYRGEIQATFKKTNGLDSIKYNVGDRGAQIIIMPYPKIYMTEVPELSDTERGSGGFGSTGK